VLMISCSRPRRVSGLLGPTACHAARVPATAHGFDARHGSRETRSSSARMG